MMVAAGCGPGSNAPPDGGPPLALDVVGESQVGVSYGGVMNLRVRYHTDDAAATAVQGAPVRFSIFYSDPKGSTLSRDVVTTDVNGIATVTLTGGQAEASFKVAATAVNAPEVDFDVSVSKFDFVEIDAKLSWSMDANLRALLYDAQTCAMLPPAATLPAPARAVSKANSTEATLQFVKLLSMSYALVGRVEDTDGNLLAQGCVDIGAGLVPPGSVSVVPIPLTPAVASPAGVYKLTSTLVPVPSAYAGLVGTWQRFGGACPYGAAQAILDAMGISSHRDAPLANGCRPTSTTSLDFQLQQLLTAPAMAPANALPGIGNELAEVTASATVTSLLTVTQASTTTYTAEHTLTDVDFTVNGTHLMMPYDLSALGAPVIDVKNVPFADDAGMVTIGTHGFTLGWTTLWLKAFTDLSLLVHLPTLGSPVIPSLVAAVVAPASHGGKTGCAGVDDLVCNVTTGSGSCALATPCASALGPVAADLAVGFAPASGLDLTLTGSAMAIDGDGDLIVDALDGTWSDAGLATGSTFSGTRQ